MFTDRMPRSFRYSSTTDSNRPGPWTVKDSGNSTVSPGAIVTRALCFARKQQLSPHVGASPTICRGSAAVLVMWTTSECSPGGNTRSKASGSTTSNGGGSAGVSNTHATIPAVPRTTASSINANRRYRMNHLAGGGTGCGAVRRTRRRKTIRRATATRANTPPATRSHTHNGVGLAGGATPSGSGSP